MTDPNSKAWSILTKSRSGAVSVIRDLTLDECRNIYARLNPNYGQTYTNYDMGDGSSASFGFRYMDGGEIEIREVFGPIDWDRSEISEWDAGWPQFVTKKVG